MRACVAISLHVYVQVCTNWVATTHFEVEVSVKRALRTRYRPIIVLLQA
jgi:hypothetical protein